MCSFVIDNLKENVEGTHCTVTKVSRNAKDSRSRIAKYLHDNAL